MTEHDAFMQAICENPTDDAPRLMYADWLTENGQEERAEFIRVQCELARYYHDMRHDPTGVCRGCKGTNRARWCWECQRRRRERELLESMHPYPVRAGVRVLARYAWAGLVVEQLPDPDQQGWQFRRGFVADITLTAEDWLAHADRLVEAAPLEEVMLTSWPRPFYSADLLAAGFLIGPNRNRWSKIVSNPLGMASDNRDISRLLLETEWGPRIKFTLPDMAELTD